MGSLSKFLGNIALGVILCTGVTQTNWAHAENDDQATKRCKPSYDSCQLKCDPKGVDRTAAAICWMECKKTYTHCKNNPTH